MPEFALRLGGGLAVAAGRARRFGSCAARPCAAATVRALPCRFPLRWRAIEGLSGKPAGSIRSMPQRSNQPAAPGLLPRLRRSCFMAAGVVAAARRRAAPDHGEPRPRPRIRRRHRRRPAGRRGQHLHHPDAERAGGGTPHGPGPEGLALRGVLRRFLRRRGQGGPAAQSELARLRLRHRPLRPRRHQQSRHRGRRRDHHQLHRRHQAEGHQGSRPRPQDRPRAAARSSRRSR